MNGFSLSFLDGYKEIFINPVNPDLVTREWDNPMGADKLKSKGKSLILTKKMQLRFKDTGLNQFAGREITARGL